MEIRADYAEDVDCSVTLTGFSAAIRFSCHAFLFPLTGRVGFFKFPPHTWRRGQVAKAEDCKSFIPGSNPGGASSFFFLLFSRSVSALGPFCGPRSSRSSREPGAVIFAQRFFVPRWLAESQLTDALAERVCRWGVQWPTMARSRSMLPSWLVFVLLLQHGKGGGHVFGKSEVGTHIPSLDQQLTDRQCFGHSDLQIAQHQFTRCFADTDA